MASMVMKILSKGAETFKSYTVSASPPLDNVASPRARSSNYILETASSVGKYLNICEID